MCAFPLLKNFTKWVNKQLSKVAQVQLIFDLLKSASALLSIIFSKWILPLGCLLVKPAIKIMMLKQRPVNTEDLVWFPAMSFSLWWKVPRYVLWKARRAHSCMSAYFN